MKPVVCRNTITMENDAGGGGFSYAIGVSSRTVVEANTIKLPPGPLGLPNEIGIKLAGEAIPTGSRET